MIAEKIHLVFIDSLIFIKIKGDELVQPEVTLICSTYNHEKYIAQAIESFVNQKTTFKYEVVIHDDCSTDKTVDIIKRYAEKYPNLIRPIYEEENQYSKGKKISLEIVSPTIQSKYMCFCEGDDYLVSEEKLQKQYDYMESHPECTLCSHSIKNVDIYGNDVSVRVGLEGDYNIVDILDEKEYILILTIIVAITNDIDRAQASAAASS